MAMEQCWYCSNKRSKQVQWQKQYSKIMLFWAERCSFWLKPVGFGPDCQWNCSWKHLAGAVAQWEKVGVVPGAWSEATTPSSAVPEAPSIGNGICLMLSIQEELRLWPALHPIWFLRGKVKITWVQRQLRGIIVLFLAQIFLPPSVLLCQNFSQNTEIMTFQNQNFLAVRDWAEPSSARRQLWLSDHRLKNSVNGALSMVEKEWEPVRCSPLAALSELDSCRRAERELALHAPQWHPSVC